MLKALILDKDKKPIRHSFATSEFKIKIKHEDKVVSYSNSEAETPVCPGCQEPLVPKLGSIVPSHFSHFQNSDCTYSAPESAWHLAWKSLMPVDNVEVKIGNNRADILTLNNRVVEIQASRYTPEVYKERLLAYRKGQVCADGRILNANCIFIFKAVKYDIGASNSSSIKISPANIKDYQEKIKKWSAFSGNHNYGNSSNSETYEDGLYKYIRAHLQLEKNGNYISKLANEIEAWKLGRDKRIRALEQQWKDYPCWPQKLAQFEQKEISSEQKQRQFMYKWRCFDIEPEEISNLCKRWERKILRPVSLVSETVYSFWWKMPPSWSVIPDKYLFLDFDNGMMFQVTKKSESSIEGRIISKQDFVNTILKNKTTLELGDIEIRTAEPVVSSITGNNIKSISECHICRKSVDLPLMCFACFQKICIECSRNIERLFAPVAGVTGVMPHVFTYCQNCSTCRKCGMQMSQKYHCENRACKVWFCCPTCVIRVENWSSFKYEQAPRHYCSIECRDIDSKRLLLCKHCKRHFYDRDSKVREFCSDYCQKELEKSRA